MADIVKPRDLEAAGLSSGDGVMHWDDGTMQWDGDFEICPCLIGRFHQRSAPSPSYFMQIQCSDGSIGSVDMVRLALSLSGEESGRWLIEHGATSACDEFSTYTSKIKPGAWYVLDTYGLGDSTAILGIGHFSSSSKLDMNKDFLEFNPNKVAQDGRFWRLLRCVKARVAHAAVKRFDLAWDVRRSKNECCLTRDRRRYECVISNGVTEYLGIKNSPGFVKVYDKAAELQLADGVELTRVELTCDGEWSADDVMKHWPQVHAWSGELAPDAPKRSLNYLQVAGLCFKRLAAQAGIYLRNFGPVLLSSSLISLFSLYSRMRREMAAPFSLSSGRPKRSLKD